MSNPGRRPPKTDRTPAPGPLSSAGSGEEDRLLDRARGGDTRSYGHLVRAYQDRIYGLIIRMVRDPALAEELTQDVFIKAYRNLGSFRGEARFTTWLYRIAVNLCHDHRASQAARVEQRESSLDGPELEGVNPRAQGSQPDEMVEEREVAAGFQAGLEALEPMYREAFLLRHQEGLGYDEIAEILEISKANAKVRVHRAREMILDALRERGFDV